MKSIKEITKAITTPGVFIQKEWGVPLFWYEDNDTELLVRELNGIREKGKLINGKFIVIERV